MKKKMIKWEITTQKKTHLLLESVCRKILELL